MKCVIDLKREADRPLVCSPCRTGLADDLRALVDAYAMLVVIEDLDGGKDPVSQTLPAGTVRSGVRDAPVTGSREAPVPVNLDLVDLTGGARSGRVRDTLVPLVQTQDVEVIVRRVDRVTVVREEINEAGERIEKRDLVPVDVDEIEHRRERVPIHGGYGETVMVSAGDQIGLLPVATVLDQWVRDWISHDWCPGDHLPVPTVVTLVDWLGKRLDVACDRHDAIDEFADEIRDLLHACHRVRDNVPARPEYLDGVPCSGCDLMALSRKPGDRYRAECGNCGRLYTDDEYENWTGLLAARARAA